MHRFRKKQDLKNIDFNIPTTNESQISNSTTLELPSLPPASDFRTSLILPTLTKRFSVLRRGNNNNDTKKTSLTQETPSEVNVKDFNNNTTTTNQVSKIKPGRSPLSNLTEEESLPTLPINNNVNVNNSNNNNNNINNNNNDNNNNNQQVLSNARKFYDPSFRTQNTADVSNANNDVYNKNGNNVKGKDFSFKNDKNEIINQSVNVSPVKSLRRTSSDGLLVNPTKDRSKLPRIRPPSTVQVPQGYSWKNDFTTFPKDNKVTSPQLPQQVSPTKNSPRGLSPRMTNFDSNDQDSLLQPSSPRSPLDKLSEGLYNIQIQSSPNLSPSSPLYNTQNLSQTSLRSFGGSSINEEEEMKLSIQKSPSINSLRNIESENTYNSDRASTTSTIGSSLKRIGTMKTTSSNISSNSINSSNSNNNNNNGSFDNEGYNEGVEGDDEAENGNIRDSNGTGIMYLKNTLPNNDAKIKNQSEIQPGSSASSMSNMTDLSNSTTGIQKKPSRGRRTPPPKPQPPPLSLTDTLIASGQSDIAHQVMIMRRAQNVNQQQLLPQNQSNTRQNSFKKWPKKNAVIKNISGPQLVSTSSNVKTIPIVQLDDDKLRRKRDSETGIGKSLRRIRDVFTSDSESALFGKKRTSLVSSNENLSRKFVSDDNLNRRFVNNEKGGLDFVKRRALSTRESDRPNNRLRQDIKNNFVFTINDDQQLSRDDVYTSGNTQVNDKSGQQPLYDIYALKRHAEMVSRYSSNKKVDNPTITTITSRSSSQSSLSLTVDNPNESESMPSSPISPFSDYPSSTSTPPPISPRNPLRQQDKSLMLYSTGSQNSISDAGSDDRDSKDSKASSSRLMSIFSNRSSKSSSRNSKSSDANHLQVSQTNDNQKSNKVIRRTIIITKPYLPPLPEDSAPSTPIFPSSSANSSSSSLINSKSALKKKKINPDDGKIHVASDGRQWFLSKNTSNNDENDKKIENVGDSALLSIPTQKASLNDRPPTPIPSPNTRENAMDLPYGIPIPPIPSPHRNSVASKTSKRTSKSSIASSLKSSSSKYNRKSIGNKSVYSTYGESIYDYYDYSDHEVADDESDSNSNVIRRQQLEARQHVEVLEMSDGSYVWQVVNGLRSEDMEDRYSYYYAGANNDDNDENNDYSQIWPQDFGRLNYGRDLEDDQISQLSFNDQQQNDNNHLDYDATNDLNSSQSSSKQKHGQYLTPDVISSRNTRENRLMNNTNSTISISSSEEENSIPRTSVYFAKDVPLPKLLEEMTRGFGSIDSDREEIQYMYGGEVGAGGTGVVGEMTVEEKLDQVMRALGVDERDVY